MGQLVPSPSPLPLDPSVARPSLPVARLIRLAGGPDLLVVHRRLDRALQAMVRVREIV